MLEGMACAFLGNFSRPFTTESHVAASLESLGLRVARIQEGKTDAKDVANIVRATGADFFLWTQTYDLAEMGGTKDERLHMLADIRQLAVPSIGFHLDRWWGLDRETQIFTEPFFSVDFLFTADGGNDEKWQQAGVNHYWLPPGVYHAECYDGRPDPRYRNDIIFVGSWRHYAHEEHWKVRHEMLNALTKRYGNRFGCYPSNKAIRGDDLNRLYASCKVAVGDSCYTGSPGRYFSDRITETLGRGALIVHPSINGLETLLPDLPTFPQGDWDAMFKLIEDYLEHPELLHATRSNNVFQVRAYHTYQKRMLSMLETVGLTSPV